jgi:predicted permease
MIADLRYTFRLLRRAPAFTAAAVATLALGIGANTAVFTLVDAVLFRPLPYKDPARLVMISESHVESGQQRVGVLPGSFLDWRDRSRSFEGLSLLSVSPTLITNVQEPTRVITARVSPKFFEVIGVGPIIGHSFTSNEREVIEEGARAREILIGHGLWQRWFGGDPGVLGKTLQIQGAVELTIVGVMPSGFAFPRGAEIWGPDAWDRSGGRGDRWRHAIGRLKPGVSIDSAARELRDISAQLGTEFPQTNAGWTTTVDSVTDAVVGPVRPALAAMLAAVALVFLIACVNVSTLTLHRGLRRQRELAMRAALGASRKRLARQSLVEHAVLAGLGVLAGSLLAVYILDGLVAIAPAAIPRLDTIVIDLRVLLYLALLALATVAITGIVPALRSSRADATTILKGGAGGSGASVRGRGLVVAEVALALVLLMGAGLMVRTMINLQRIDLGFEPSGVVATELQVPISRMTQGPLKSGVRPAWDQLALYYERVVEQLEALPGVQRAAAVAAPVLTGRDGVWFARPGNVRPRADGSPEWQPIQHRVITPGYLDVVRLPLLQGRAFSDQDHALEFLRTGKGRRRGVAIVNSAAARLFWPGQEPLGQSITIDGESRVDGRTVVGVTRDARDLAPDIEPPPTVYVPYAENPDFAATLLVRLRDGGGPSPADIRARLRSIDSLLLVGNVQPLANSYATALAPRRFITIVLIAFAGAGVLIAGIGLYGLIALSVTHRTREFGIRLALGASWDGIRRMVLGEAARVVGLGVAIGVVGAASGTGLLRTQLFGVTPLDLRAMIATIGILLSAGWLAAWLPARRAASIDPAVTLRDE